RVCLHQPHRQKGERPYHCRDVGDAGAAVEQRRLALSHHQKGRHVPRLRDGEDTLADRLDIEPCAICRHLPLLRPGGFGGYSTINHGAVDDVQREGTVETSRNREWMTTATQQRLQAELAELEQRLTQEGERVREIAADTTWHGSNEVIPSLTREMS